MTYRHLTPFPFSLASLLLLSLAACQNRAPSLRMLDARSGYADGPDDEEVALYQKGRASHRSLVRKSAPRVARVYLYPHELPSKDYFWGGYISLVVSPDEWLVPESETLQLGTGTDVSLPPAAELVSEVPHLPPTPASVRHDS